MIEIQRLVKWYGKRAVAAGLSLHVAVGESVALSGPSGSGKTTLLRILAGLEAPDSGAIRLAGRNVDFHNAPHTRGIGFLFQTAALWPHMSVADNILFGLEGFPRAWQKSRAEELLERVGLAGFSGRHPGTLSGGEARRVALARALAPQRPILFLDEPTANLDTELRRQILGLIAEERKAHGTTIVLATHEPNDAVQLADRYLTLQNGQLIPVVAS